MPSLTAHLSAPPVSSSSNSGGSQDHVMQVLNRALSYFQSNDLPELTLQFKEPPIAAAVIDTELASTAQMTEALQRQLRLENDSLRKQVNQLHEKLFKLKKKLKDSSDV